MQTTTKGNKSLEKGGDRKPKKKRKNTEKKWKGLYGCLFFWCLSLFSYKKSGWMLLLGYTFTQTQTHTYKHKLYVMCYITSRETEVTSVHWTRYVLDDEEQKKNRKQEIQNKQNKTILTQKEHKHKFFLYRFSCHLLNST